MAMAAGAAEPKPKAAAPEPVAFPPFAAGNFTDFDSPREMLTAEALKKLLTQAPGEGYNVGETQKGEQRLAAFSGLARLGLPWPADQALRVSLLDFGPLQIHLWAGNEARTLAFYRDAQQTWAVYAGVREGGKPRPVWQALLGTSGDRHRRVGLATFDLLWRDKTLYMLRGDLVILQCPMPTAPSEVFFEGTALIKGLAVAPNPWTPPAEEQAKLVAPAERAWQMKPVEGAALNKLPNGIELTAGDKTEACQAGFLLDRSGMLELIVQVDQAEPGTGIFLGTAEGQQLARIAFVRHRETGKMAFEIQHQWANDSEKSFEVARQPLPLLGSGQWLRLTCGGSAFRCWTSGDGVHWSQIALGGLGVEGNVRQVGLYALKTDKKRTIRLRSLEVRPLTAIASLAPADLVAKAPSMKAAALPAWREEAEKAKPADVAWGPWWRACAIRTLAEGPKDPVGQPLLDRLVMAGFEMPGSAESKLRLLDELALCYKVDDWETINRFPRAADYLGRMLIAQGEPAPCTLLNRALLRSPFWHQQVLPVFLEAPLRQELFARASQDSGENFREFARRLRFWGGGRLPLSEPLWKPQIEYLASWSEASAGLLRRGDRPGANPQLAEQPYIEQRSKDTSVSGFRRAIQEEAFDAACKMVARIDRPEDLGLQPTDDPRLLLSFPLMVELAMRDHPPLRQAMQQKAAAVGRLRVKSAAGSGNAEAMHTVTLQFPGTEVSAEAHRWLGDRSLAAGRFVEALAHYRQATGSAGEEEREGLAARTRLAGAMLGLDLGQPVRSGVQLGGTWLSGPEFEKLIEQARVGRAPAVEKSGGLAFAPGRYEARPWAKYEARDARRPNGFPERGIDWYAAQLGVAVTPRQIILHSRAVLTVLSLETGQVQWAQPMPSAGEAILHFPMMAMQPVPAAGRIFLRRMTKDGPELACFEGADGKLLWSNKPDGYVASDPMFVGQKLLALTITAEGSDRVTLALVELAPTSGRVRNRTAIAQFREVWNKQFPCQATAVEDRIVAAAGGAVFQCDSSGRVLWLRKQIWIRPPTFDPSQARDWLAQTPAPPIVGGDRVIVAQPGVWGVECLDFNTGRLVWRQPMGTLVRLVGRTPRQVVVETSEAIVSLDAGTGRVRWMHPVDECLDVRLCGPGGPVVLAEPSAKREGPQSPVAVLLTWLDMETGKPMGRSALRDTEIAGPLFRPLLAGNGRLWGLRGASGNPQLREFFELTKTGDIQPADEEETRRWSGVP